jgi:hypothetical protein
MNSLRVRVAVLVSIIVLVIAGAGGYVLYTRSQQAQAQSQAPLVAVAPDLSAITGAPHVVFRSTALGNGYGKVAVVALADPKGPRGFTPASCDRVYATGEESICLSSDRGITTTYKAQILGPQWTPTHDLPLTGLPSRARLSRDGQLTATTTFVYGDSYASPGQFSTRTLVTRDDGTQVADLEQFTLTVDGKVITAADKNLWGVTFFDGDTFYATAASGQKTWLVKGSLAGKSMASIREDVECPSLSPDKTRIAFKKRGDLPRGQWRLSVYDLATGQVTELAETRSVDDQVEWLDDAHILYGLARNTSGGGAVTSDVWMVPADGSGSAEVFVPEASSPAVVR